ANPLHCSFSDVDTGTVSEFGRPIYLADYAGYLKFFEPGEAVISLLTISA
ncbi:MAG: hypothetical protein ACI8V0_003074, partial [Pseudohongiellaceae bacterium]